MSFFCACPGISPQRCSACPHRGVVAESYPIRTVIQFSICPSIGRQREGSFINPLNKSTGNFFAVCTKEFLQTFCELWLQRQKEPVHSTSNQREKISRHIFDETMYRLCFSETFSVCCFRSAGRLSNRSGAAAISFDGCLVFHFRYSVVDSAMRAKYSIAYRTLVRQPSLDHSLKIGAYYKAHLTSVASTSRQY